MAEKLSDSQKIYVPHVSENTDIQSQTVGVGSSQISLININQAAAGELDSLPRVGPVTAQKIINSRPYSRIEDLLNKKIVSSKVFSEIKDKIAVY